MNKQSFWATINNDGFLIFQIQIPKNFLREFSMSI